MDLLGRAALATAIKNKLKASAWADIVSDYGADPKGNHDSSAAFQRAIDEINSAGGGRLVLPIGTFIANFTFKSRVLLSGSGKHITSTVLKPAAPGPVITFDRYVSSATIVRLQPATTTGDGVSRMRFIDTPIEQVAIQHICLVPMRALNDLGMHYEREVKLEGCQLQRQLAFDFGVYKDGMLLFLIEFDGEQHYRMTQRFGGEEKLTKLQQRDAVKDSYCMEHGIPLLRISYQSVQRQGTKAYGLVKDQVETFVNEVFSFL